jgi:hypothetical protein
VVVALAALAAAVVAASAVTDRWRRLVSDLPARRGPDTDSALVGLSDATLKERSMHEDLWANVEGKLGEAQHEYEQMQRSLRPPERTRSTAALEAAGARVDTRWQDSFWPAVNNFLGKVRSVPWIIEACFGKDVVKQEMKHWFNGLTADEQQRRESFSKEFDHKVFRDHYLTNGRDIAVHRLGSPDVKVEVVGPFGQTHTATPSTRIPMAETRPLEANIDDPAKQ